MMNILNIEKEIKVEVEVEVIKNIKKIREDIDQDLDQKEKKIKKEEIIKMRNLLFHKKLLKKEEP